MAEAFIHVEDLRFSYEDGESGERTEVLHGIDLDIEEGSFVAVLGHNGSGKSTLAKLLNMKRFCWRSAAVSEWCFRIPITR